MSDRLQNALILISVLGCGLVGGVFFAFSSFVMGALARLPTAQGIVAMQSINVVVINPVFLGVFLGMGATCSALMVTGLRSAFGPREFVDHRRRHPLSRGLRARDDAVQCAAQRHTRSPRPPCGRGRLRLGSLCQ